MSVLSKEALAESEIILNRTNIALARSRKLIQSWLTNPVTESQVEEDDEDFKPESETAGIGSTVQDDDSGGPGRIARSRQANNDKLLEQILGKKAAQVHRRSQQANSKPIGTEKSDEKISKRRDSSDDQDESRASTITQGIARKSSKPVNLKPLNNEETKTAAIKNMVISFDNAGQATERHVNRIAPAKRRATSYLDELLAKKARKKSKKG